MVFLIAVGFARGHGLMPIRTWPRRSVGPALPFGVRIDLNQKLKPATLEHLVQIATGEARSPGQASATR